MAITLPLPGNVPKDYISDNVPDKPSASGWTAADLKAAFDKAANEIKDYLGTPTTGLVAKIVEQCQESLAGKAVLSLELTDLTSADQIRHIYITNQAPTSASPDGIYLVVASS